MTIELKTSLGADNVMSHNLFIIILRYRVSLEQINALRAAHLEFLTNYYAKNLFLLSGPQVPRTGGVIIAQCDNKTALENILKDDPFAVNNLATYEIIEFHPTNWNPVFDNFLFNE